MLLLTAFVDVTSVILLYRITLQTSILNGISESGTPATYADMLLIIIIIYMTKHLECCNAKVRGGGGVLCLKPSTGSQYTINRYR